MTGWSTREVAQLAGTTLRTVRHYHEIGLLDEPARTPNGYKAYRTEHLVRLLEIRRLSRLGLPLSTIASVIQESGDLDATLAGAEAYLDATISELQRARAEVIEMRRNPAKTDLPSDVSVAASNAGLSAADRSLYAVITQISGDRSHPHWSSMLQGFVRTPAIDAFDTLSEDADEKTRAQVAEQFIPHSLEWLAKYPLPPDALPPTVRERATFSRAVIDAMLDIYNPAQLDVLARVMRAAGLV